MNAAIYPNRSEMEAFTDTVTELANLANKVSEVRGKLVLAGVGTFNTEKERVFLIKLEDRIEAMRIRLQKRARRAARNAPVPAHRL